MCGLQDPSDSSRLPDRGIALRAADLRRAFVAIFLTTLAFPVQAQAPVPEAALPTVPAPAQRVAAPLSPQPPAVATPDAALDLVEAQDERSLINRSLDESNDAAEEETPAGDCEGRACAKHPYAASDLQTYFTKDDAGYQAFRRHDYRRARKLLLNEPASPPVRYLRAMSSFYQRDDLAAADELSQLAPEYPGLRDYCRFYAAMAYERLGLPLKATDSYAAVRGQSSLFFNARMAMSRLLQRRHDLHGASVTLLPLVAPDQLPPVQARAWTRIAELSRQKGDHRAERRALLAVWAADPLSALAAQAQRRLSGSAIPYPWRVAHAEALINLHLNVQGMHALEAMFKKLPVGTDLGCRARFDEGQALRKERQHARAIHVLEPLLRACRPNEQLTPRIEYVLGYSQSVMNPPAAIETYLSLARDYPRDDHADAALFFAADLMARAGDEDRALETLGKIVSAYADRGLAAKALFQSFWIHRDRSELPAGLAALERLQRLPTRALTFEDMQRAQYWQARTLEQLGQLDEAQMRLEGIAMDQASSYYGLLARLRLKEVDPERSERLMQTVAARQRLDFGWPLDAGPLADEPHFRAGIELLRLGLPGAPTELLALDRTRIPGEPLVLLFQALHAAGKDAAAELVARATIGLDERARAPEARPLWEAAFPQKFRNLIVQHTARTRVPADLMQALIREESGFNPRARSATGAIGLAQLMPSTAGALARRSVSATSLMNPKQNIRLGSAYLGSLLKRFAGNEALAVASYNAGPGAVQKWLRQQPDAELDAFVESIPFDETRRYVKRVLGSFSTYEMLYRAKAKPVIEAKADVRSGGSR